MTPQTHHPPSPVAPATGKKIYASQKLQAGCIFLTVNTYKRVSVFRERTACEIFFRELAFYRQQYGFQLYAYVLMPNHFHLLMGFPPERKFADFLRDFKSAVGRYIIDWAQQNNRMRLLARLQLHQSPRRRKDARYCLLQPNSYVRSITSASMFKQKLDYIHRNPIRECLVAKAIDYPYSSLRNYELGVGRVSIDSHNFLL